MKIEGNGRVSGAGSARRSGKGQAVGDRFSLSSSEPASTLSSAGVQGPAPVNALLALQEVPDAMGRRARAVRQGTDVLDQLESLKLCILSGGLPKSRLDDLIRSVRTRREAVDDPRLKETLDEIELRAEVELAKLGF